MMVSDRCSEGQCGDVCSFASQPCARIDQNSPVAFASTILLGLFWINVDVAMLAEELWEHWLSRLLVLLAVNAFTEFVGAGHC